MVLEILAKKESKQKIEKKIKKREQVKLKNVPR
jgi:hypothetical protein